jgi:hypothetical protein
MLLEETSRDSRIEVSANRYDLARGESANPEVAIIEL